MILAHVRAARCIVLLAAAALVPHALAQTQPKAFAHGDAAKGRALTEKDCVACHARRFDGKPDQMYLRPDHKVHTPEQLIAQVRVCNAQLGTNYFPEEEEHVAAYLNLTYYKFRP